MPATYNLRIIHWTPLKFWQTLNWGTPNSAPAPAHYSIIFVFLPDRPSEKLGEIGKNQNINRFFFAKQRKIGKIDILENIYSVYGNSIYYPKRHENVLFHSVFLVSFAVKLFSLTARYAKGARNSQRKMTNLFPCTVYFAKKIVMLRSRSCFQIQHILRFHIKFFEPIEGTF
jgi:hypothetical protein